MPELPEVETVSRGLKEILLPVDSSITIKKVELFREGLRTPFSEKLEKVRNLKVLSVQRRAKFILVETSKGILLNHLGMTGKWRVLEDGHIAKHDHLVLHLSNKKKLVYNDSRRFGLFEIADKGAVTENKWLKFLGPEPLDKKNFNSTYLFQRSRSRKVPVKAFIMDQKVVVGVGNIYASEALFRAGLRPQIRANKLTQQDAKQLAASVRTIISKAIKSGGTTIRDFAQTNGQKGYFARQLKVYGRTGEPCFDCQTEICCQSIGGRSSFWCPHCQK